MRVVLIEVEYSKSSASSTFFDDVSTNFNSFANFFLIGEGIFTSSSFARNWIEGPTVSHKSHTTQER